MAGLYYEECGIGQRFDHLWTRTAIIRKRPS